MRINVLLLFAVVVAEMVEVGMVVVTVIIKKNGSYRETSIHSVY